MSSGSCYFVILCYWFTYLLQAFLQQSEVTVSKLCVLLTVPRTVRLNICVYWLATNLLMADQSCHTQSYITTIKLALSKTIPSTFAVVLCVETTKSSSSIYQCIFICFFSPQSKIFSHMLAITHFCWNLAFGPGNKGHTAELLVNRKVSLLTATA